MKFIEKIANLFDLINEKVGNWTSYFTAILVLVICIDVAARYLFSVTYIWILEIEIYLFALIFLLGSGYAFKHDKHVRVDVFYSKASPKGKAWINLIGGVLFLLPWCVVVLQVAWRYAEASYLMNESSAQQGGLPALYLLKFIILLGFVLLTLQAISSIIRSVLVIRK